MVERTAVPLLRSMPGENSGVPRALHRPSRRRLLTSGVDLAMNYLVDTNIINWLIDGKISNSEMPGDGKFIATHIQIDEINKTSDEERRARLFLTLASSLSGLAQTETTVADVSRFDFCKVGDGAIYTSLRAKLDAMNGGRPSNIRDALIAEVAIINGYTLLTADKDLAQATNKHGGMVQLFSI